jgi:uncharacterized membrane protein YqgA involved in biofilm formation
MFGTLANAVAIVVGSTIGALARSRFPQKYIDIAFQSCGLFTLVIGISMALKSENMILIVVSIISGALIGEALNLDGKTEKIANFLLKKLTKKEGNSEKTNTSRLAVEGFVTASVLFCTGSMAILGSFEDGMGKFPQILYTKSIMDGIISVALASSFGIFVGLSAVPVLIYQGMLTLFAAYIIQFMTDAMIADLTSVGGILLIGLGLTILKIKEIKVINMLPALVIIVLLSMVF